MVLQLNHVVVHELIKEQHQAIQPSNLREAVLDPANEIVTKLVGEVSDIYGTRYNSAHYGVFKEGEGRGSFPDSFQEYADLEDLDDEAFLQLTKVAMERLYDKASSTTPAVGGYVLFSDFTNAQGRFFLIAMVRKTPGITLSPNLEPEELDRLDLSKLHQAARINFSKMAAFKAANDDERKDLNFLSFISSTAAKSASGYFVMAVGCAPGAASNRATDNLLKESKKFFRETEGLSAKKEEFINDLLGYLEDKENTNTSVKLSEVGHMMTQHIPVDLVEQTDEMQNAFMTRLNSEEVGVPSEFPVSRSALNKHTRITAKGNSWRFSFDKCVLGEDEAAEVYYDRQNQSLTLTNLPEKMKQDVLEALSELALDQDD